MDGNFDRLTVHEELVCKGRFRVTTDWGYLEFGGISRNELSIVSTVDDPPKLRIASRVGGSLGCISFNKERPDGSNQDEVVLIQGKIDERTRDNPASLAGEVTVHIRRNQDGPDDAAMIKVTELRSDSVPDGGGGSAPMSFLRSPNGQFDVEMQDDGLVTCYDELNGHHPLWQIRKVEGVWMFVSLS